METRNIGGMQVRKPASVVGLEVIKKTLLEKGTEAAIKQIDIEIEQRWSVDGYWSHVRLERV